MAPLVSPLVSNDDPELAALLESMAQTGGYVPNSVRTMARRPGLPAAFAQLARVVLGPGHIDRELKSLIALVASVAAGCRYCQAHTSTSATRAGGDNARVQAAWQFETSPAFSEAERVLLRLARDAANVPNLIDDRHRAELAVHHDEVVIAEAVAVIALFGFLNRWNDTMGTTLEDMPASAAQVSIASLGWNAGKHA
ncbi:MAG: carboxymuconolactone decarboxylase family protein [Acidimicrobiales bacterium]